MPTPQDLVKVLHDGKGRAKYADALGPILGLRPGRTQEDVRALARKGIIEDKFPIGSSAKEGFFLIDSDSELAEVMAQLEGRIRGIRERIDALRCGWKLRQASRVRGKNWPR